MLFTVPLLLPFIPTTTMTFHPGFRNTDRPSKIWYPRGDMFFSSGRFLYFSLAVVHRDDVGFQDHNFKHTVRIGLCNARQYCELVYVCTYR